MMKEKESSRITIKRPTFYTSLIVYWFSLPILFFSYLILKMTIEQLTFQNLLVENNLLTIMLLISALTPFSAFALTYFSKDERIKNGTVGLFLKFMMGQQFLVGNIIGVVLSYLTYRELPNSGSQGITKGKKSSIYILIGIQYILSFIAIYALMMLIKSE